MAALPAPHDDVVLAPVPHRVIATWPSGTFLENIAWLSDGDFVISAHNKRELMRVGRDGASHVLAAMPASPAGLVEVTDGVFVAAGEPGQGPHRIFKVTLDGKVEERLSVPDTVFLNGFTPGPKGRAYTVDSIKGTVIQIDLIASTSRILLQHELLTKCSDEPMLPGANGVKLGDDAIFVTNTDLALVLRIPLAAEGHAGEIHILAERLRGDDLALDCEGALYITNHIHNTLIRLKPNGERVAIAGPNEGMAGSTACVFGIAAGDRAGLYVTTTGGIIMPFQGVVQEAKLIRLDTGVAGRPLTLPL